MKYVEFNVLNVDTNVCLYGVFFPDDDHMLEVRVHTAFNSPALVFLTSFKLVGHCFNINHVCVLRCVYMFEWGS